MRKLSRNGCGIYKQSQIKERTRAWLIILIIFIVTQLWLITNCCFAKTDYSRDLLSKDQAQAEKLVKKLNTTEVLGPLAPVALSPFFGLTCLSATSILSSKGVLPENEFLVGNEALNNPTIFVIFLGLTVLTSAPKLFTASKVFAEITDRIETYAGIISYGAIIMFAKNAQQSPEEVVVYSAGIITFTHSGLLACAAAVNIFIISSVKYFFELLALISPIPTLDAIFVITSKAIAGLLAAVYAFSPAAAFVLDIIIFLICLSIFNWVSRRIKYMRALMLEPMMLGLRRKLFKQVDYDPDRKTFDKFKEKYSDMDLLVKCFPNRKLVKIKKKDRCYLLFTSDGYTLVKPRILRSPVILELPKENVTGLLEQGLISYSIGITRPKDGKPAELVFSKVYTNKLDEIRSKF